MESSIVTVKAAFNLSLLDDIETGSRRAKALQQTTADDSAAGGIIRDVTFPDEL